MPEGSLSAAETFRFIQNFHYEAPSITGSVQPVRARGAPLVQRTRGYADLRFNARVGICQLAD
jgi:hypothetical protein